LRIAAEALTWQRERFAVAESAQATKHAIVLEGWVNQHKRAEIESAFTTKKLAAVLTDLEPAEDEEPPVEIENGSLIKPFEAVTRLYGMPGYKDLDPTVFLAGFFFLFFGMSLTDVGYGLFLMIAAIIVLTLFKVAPPIRLFAKLLLMVGFATVIVGALFGGYFGIPPEALPQWMQALAVYNPIDNPLPVFYTALGLGIFQVMVGMLVKIYSDYRNKDLIGGLLDQGPWLFVFILGIIYVAQVAGYIALLETYTLVNLVYVAIAMIALFSARHGKGVFGKIQAAAGALYGSIGYFSDILSYSRLLALGLATTALAFAVNLIAGMIFDKESIITWIFAGLVLLIGHVFTLAVNTLGAFIHSARLQFVEFFGKFIVGTGREFSPLKRKKKYITAIEE
jgi:V/A-type H+-transporting ATPase subunit I